MKFNSLIPELSVSDIKRSLEFYIDVLHFNLEYERPEKGFAFLSYQGSQLMLEEFNGNWVTEVPEYPFGRGINFSIETDELIAIVERLKTFNYPIMLMPEDAWYRKDDVLLGERYMLVQDPDGYFLRFQQDLGSKPA